MSFEWPLDKLDILNGALAATHDNLLTVLDDGSDEFLAASPAYEIGLAMMIEDHPWAWTKTTKTLTPASNVPSDTAYDTAYNLPSDCVHVINVRQSYDDVSWAPTVWDFQMGPTTNGPTAMQLVINAQGGPPPPSTPSTPIFVSLTYISSVTSDPTFATPKFAYALQLFVEAGIYQGLHEDIAAAKEKRAEALAMLSEAKTRHDQQKPKRAIWNSRISAARRVRRPWPQTPPSWGGTGTPG